MWFVYFDASKAMYQLSKDKQIQNWIVIFKNFDMAYDYVTKANKTSDKPAYSRWTTCGR